MDDLLLAILVGLAVSAIRIRDLLGAIAVLGAYSLVMAILWCRMNAVDVAFTEAAVGAGISTVLMLAAVARVGRRTRARTARLPVGATKGVTRAGALLAVGCTAAGLLYAVPDMPVVGDPAAPATTHPLVKRWYLEVSPDAPDSDEVAGCAVWWVEVEGQGDWSRLDASIEVGGQAEALPIGRLEVGGEGRARLDREAYAKKHVPYLGLVLSDAQFVLRDQDGQARFSGPLPMLHLADQGGGEIEEGTAPLTFLGALIEGEDPPRAMLGTRRRGSHGEVGPANVVTSVLGDYRGYDTLGETVVIFTAGLCVVALLREAQHALRRRDDDDGWQLERGDS